MEGFIEYLKMRVDSVRKVKNDFDAKGEWREALFLEAKEDILNEVIEAAEMYAGYAS